MKLEKWALVAEVGSALAVVVTLAILVVGVRDNTRSTQAATYQALMTDINRLEFRFLEEPELAAGALGWGGENFDAELAKQLLTIRIASRSFEAAYFSYRNGSLDGSQWERFHRNVCGMREAAGPESWAAVERILTQEFVLYLEESCPADASD